MEADVSVRRDMIESLQGSRLRIDFYQHAGRIAHQVLVRDDPRSWRPIIESVEGGPESQCPPSPAFQQIHRSRIESDENRGEAVMLIGGAGSNHWSACLSGDAETDSFMFDVACRCRAPAAWLGSTYRVLQTVPSNLWHDRLLISAEGYRLFLTVMSPTGDNVEDAASLHLGPGTIEIFPRVPVPSAATTCRWRYSIELPDA